MTEDNETANDFGVLFRTFLEDVVEQAPQEEPPFARILEDHFGTDPAELRVLTDEFEPYDHPNLHLALDAYVDGEGRSAQLLGVRGGTNAICRWGFLISLEPIAARALIAPDRSTM